jgi:hypothetical protein
MENENVNVNENEIKTSENNQPVNVNENVNATQQQQPTTEQNKNTIRYISNSGVYLIEFSKSLIGKLTYKELTLKDSETKEEVEANIKNEDLGIKFINSSNYDLNILLEFLRLAKKIYATQIKVETTGKNDTPIKLSARNNEDELIELYVAPIVNE